MKNTAINNETLKLKNYLAQFQTNATSWSQATDEVRDMARIAREYYTEYDLDMLVDEYETNKKAPQPLDFTKLNTPSKWNTKGIEYILNTYNKMSDSTKEKYLKRVL